MRAILVFASLVVVVGAVMSRSIDGFLHKSGNPSTMIATTAVTPAPAPAATSRSVTLQNDGRGHFQVDARVDGRRIDFLVDTGASVIALRERDAAKLGIHPVQRDYTALVSTANGKVRAAKVELNRVEVGGLTVRNVMAVVLPDEALSQNLLGMSFLSRVRWEHKNGRLILEQ
jgi:aspartyl protease family protein